MDSLEHVAPGAEIAFLVGIFLDDFPPEVLIDEECGICDAPIKLGPDQQKVLAEHPHPFPVCMPCGLRVQAAQPGYEVKRAGEWLSDGN